VFLVQAVWSELHAPGTPSLFKVRTQFLSAVHALPHVLWCETAYIITAILTAFLLQRIMVYQLCGVKQSLADKGKVAAGHYHKFIAALPWPFIIISAMHNCCCRCAGRTTWLTRARWQLGTITTEVRLFKTDFCDA
jgi:hypothetical protein